MRQPTANAPRRGLPLKLALATALALAVAWLGTETAPSLAPFSADQLLAGAFRPVVAGAASGYESFILPDPAFTTDTQLVADAAGGMHAAYHGYDSSRVMYAYCAANCDVRANWQAVQVGDRGVAIGTPANISLDPSGRPRLMWVRQQQSLGDYDYMYAACEGGCTDAANWVAVPVATSGRIDTVGRHFFDVDPSGRPAFVFYWQYTVPPDPNGIGNWFAYCEPSTDCTDPDNWWWNMISGPGLEMHDVWLTHTAESLPRLLYYASYQDGKDRLNYVECGDQCFNAAISGTTPLDIALEAGGRDYALDLDAQDRPRIAVYGDDTTDGYDRAVEYWACDSACDDPAAWQGSTVPLPASSGEYLDLKVDGQDGPHLVYTVDDATSSTYGIGYSTCTANCATASPTWTSTLVADGSEFPQMPLDDGCDFQMYNLTGGVSVTVAANSDVGIGYVASNVQGKIGDLLGACPSRERYRFASVSIGSAQETRAGRTQPSRTGRSYPTPSARWGQRAPAHEGVRTPQTWGRANSSGWDRGRGLAVEAQPQA